MSKLKIVVIYGGRSTEHEVTLRSAANVLANLDRNKYDIYAIGISPSGKWIPQNTNELLGLKCAVLPPIVEQPGCEPEREILNTVLSFDGNYRTKESIVVIPVLHGTYGEDGCIQGLLEMGGISYVGAGPKASAICMDKVVTKQLAESVSIPVVPYITFRQDEWVSKSLYLEAEIIESLGFPLFVKPASLGSSIGISRVTKYEDLRSAVNAALMLDDKILVEQGMNVREVEFAALGGNIPEISGAGEITLDREFLSYQVKYYGQKYWDNIIPAALTDLEIRRGKKICLKIFEVLQLYSMARIDLFLEKKSGRFYLNEVNTMPGFTSVSQYPTLWLQEGMSVTQLLDRLIDLALIRNKSVVALKRSL
ncbi:MAG: D-alanine--D-alanine ligase [Bdellovibrionales bacterium]|jgi:D-alanine-D-alanine ligase|nr:D-alanine--D-alanine ligase [Bdellovibrionales bacterium]MBT3526979.1 D-alanine--D-alanine ligase [Bdellovibrionales bacterium]MBT7669253.1 D-alanine--D-alanine ligase [Bdellovibrionales bacterium]